MSIPVFSLAVTVSRPPKNGRLFAEAGTFFRRRERESMNKKKILRVALVALAMVLCAVCGYKYAVLTARLVSGSESGYSIVYGVDDMHEYSYEAEG